MPHRNPTLRQTIAIGQPMARARGMFAGASARRAPARKTGAGKAATVSLSIHADLAEVEETWRAFEVDAACTAFQRFDWLAAWQKTVGAARGTTPAIVIGRDEAGSVLFILPLAVEVMGPLRRLAWLGSDLCDYNAPLLATRATAVLDAGQFPALWREIRRRLASDPRFRFDLTDLKKMPATIGDRPNPFCGLRLLEHPSSAYVATLAGDWDSFYAAKRSGATRKRERRQFKHLAEHGAVRFVTVGDPDARRATIATLIGQKSRIFARMGVPNIFDRTGYRDFYGALVANPALTDFVHVSRLEVGDAAVAASLGLLLGDCYYLILSSYQDGPLARFGVGRAHLHELLRYAIARDFRRFDFTVGDEPYKRDWCDIEVKLHDYLAAATPAGFVAVAALNAFRATKRAIKQNEVLWRLYSRARAQKGALFADRARSADAAEDGGTHQDD